MRRTGLSFAATTAALPTSVDEWRRVLAGALDLPVEQIKLPPQFSIVNTDTGDLIETFGDPRAPTPLLTSGDPLKQRRSGVIISLMPAPHPHTDKGPFAAKAKQLYSGSTFSRAGQPVQGGHSDAQRQPPAHFSGIDLVFPVTMRTSKMRAHAGQISFPGGRCDGAETAVEAAIREAREEIDLKITAADVLGCTSQLYSFPSKSMVSPVVSLFSRYVEPRIASTNEVDSIHYLSLGALLFDTTHHHRVERGWKETGPMRMPAFYDPEGNLVWGLTAFSICELVGRVATVLGHTPLVSDDVLRSWKDERLIPYRYVKLHNPYEHVWTSPLK